MKQVNAFSFSDFKKWMAEQASQAKPKDDEDMLGSTVQSKVSAKHLLSKMTVDEGEASEMAKEFRKHGGTVVDMNDNTFLIEVESGTFTLPKFFVKKA